MKKKDWRSAPRRESPYNHLFWKRLREARELAGLGQDEAARRLRVATPTLSRLESGIRWPRLDTLLHAEREYGRPLLWLIGSDANGEFKGIVEAGFDPEALAKLREYPPDFQRHLLNYLAPALHDLILHEFAGVQTTDS